MRRSAKAEGKNLLSEIDIRSMASDAAYERGRSYYRNGRVKKLYRNESFGYYADVQGTRKYHAYVAIDEHGDVENYGCTCPAAELYDGPCKHVVATLFEIMERQHGWSTRSGSRVVRSKEENRPSDAKRLLELFAPEKAVAVAPQAETHVHLVPRLFAVTEYRQISRWLEFRIGAEKLYVLRNLHDFLKQVANGDIVQFGKGLKLDTRHMKFADETSEKLWGLLRRAQQTEREIMQYSTGFSYYGYGNFLFDQKRFKLTPALLREFLAIMGDTSIEMHFEDEEPVDVHVVHEPLPIYLELKDEGRKGATIEMRSKVGPLQALTTDADISYAPYEGVLYQNTVEESAQRIPALRAFSETRRLHLDEKDLEPFFRKVLPAMEDALDVKVDDSFEKRFQLAPLHASLYLDYHGDGVEVRPVFAYEEQEFNPLTSKGPQKKKNGRILVRDDRSEQEITNVFLTYGFTPEGPAYVQEDEARSYDFLTEALPALAEKAEVYYADAFQKKPVQPMPQVTAGVSVSQEGLLEVTFSMEDIDFDEILAILKDYREKRRYHRMKDGTFVTLGEQQLSGLADFVETTGLKKGVADEDGKALLPLSNAMVLDAIAREDEGLHLERSKAFRRVVRDIRNPQDADVETDVPKSLEKVLRDYQVTGFNWLSSLAYYGLGGILADDMGLGKTLQVLAFLLAQRDGRKAPSLVVAPTSLVYNWLDEAERFTPELRAKVIAGTKAERKKLLAATGTECDVLITTYNMLRRDIDLYAERTFRYVFLDEAQHIKNPSTQAARAVKQLRAADYFALTGTPIENTLTELWSIFDFLMPGYLLNHNSFKARYEVPIIKEENQRAMKNLQRHVMPFILRRLKKDVLKELPDKVERRMACEMTPKQEKVYRAWFIQGQKEFRDVLKEHGIDGSRLKILAILTRLRQVACDPSLFLEDYDGGSGKLDMLEEVVTDAIAAGHRMLIFSQFTTMLAHIGERLAKLRVPYLYLDGSTPSLERLRLVKEFNGGRGSVFLISLKAGGTGLNLTGADMVIHFDPWWNPAVEDQATDRAYRLGQKNNVQVLKFITKDTIEEKIYKLQEKKKSLIDQMIQPGENFLSKLTDAEIAALFEK